MDGLIGLYTCIYTQNGWFMDDLGYPRVALLAGSTSLNSVPIDQSQTSARICSHMFSLYLCQHKYICLHYLQRMNNLDILRYDTILRCIDYIIQ